MKKEVASTDQTCVALLAVTRLQTVASHDTVVDLWQMIDFVGRRESSENWDLAGAPGRSLMERVRVSPAGG